MSKQKTFLYVEIQLSMPFSEVDWKTINEAMKQVDGMVSKTWLSGVNTNSLGGFYEFESVETARNYSTGFLADFAKEAGANLSTKIFNGDVVEEASRGMDSPYYL